MSHVEIQCADSCYTYIVLLTLGCTTSAHTILPTDDSLSMQVPTAVRIHSALSLLDLSSAQLMYHVLNVAIITIGAR